MTVTIIVKQTPVGRGVFATQAFRKEETVSVISGEVIAENDYGSDYCVDLGNGTVLEPSAPFCYLNHSCAPNCELIVWEEDETPPEMCLHAVADIRVGDELTIDYAWAAEAAIPCHCQSQKCRGWIVAKAELDKVADSVPSPALL